LYLGEFFSEILDKYFLETRTDRHWLFADECEALV
jgi:hypothetical protein